MKSKTDPIKAAGAEKIKAASKRAQKELAAVGNEIELSACGGLKCHPLSMARKLAISRFIEAFPDADETELALVSTYVLSLPKDGFWMATRNSKAMLGKAAAFADESDPIEFESLMNDAAVKIGHLQESSAMSSDGGGEDDQGNAPSSQG